MKTSPSYWIAVVASSHVARGVAGGFAQLGHGTPGTLSDLKRGDWIVFYSPRTHIEGGDKVRSFTALGQIISDEPYEARRKNPRTGCRPWRVNVRYRKSATAAPIQPLLKGLELTSHRGPHWGIAFRRSRIPVSRSDLRKIAKAMGYTLPPIR